MGARVLEKTVPAIYTMRLSPELKDALGLKADEAGLPLNEYMARILAEHIGQPELGKIPRVSIGRPRNADKKARRNGVHA